MQLVHTYNHHKLPHNYLFAEYKFKTQSTVRNELNVKAHKMLTTVHRNNKIKLRDKNNNMNKQNAVIKLSWHRNRGYTITECEVFHNV